MRTLCGKPPIAFYAKVLVLESAEDAEIRGKFGWMLGVSADEDEAVIHSYQVHFDEIETGFIVRPEDLEATCEVAPRERFFSGKSIRVRVDEQGRGHLV